MTVTDRFRELRLSRLCLSASSPAACRSAAYHPVTHTPSLPASSPRPLPLPPPPTHTDVSSKLYKPSAYYVAKQLAVLPFAVLNSLLFAFTLYGLAGLRHSAVAVGINGLMSVLIYLIAAQVRGRGVFVVLTRQGGWWVTRQRGG